MITGFVTLVSIAVVLVFAGAVMMSTIQQPAKAITGPVPFTPSQNATVQNATANSSAASSIVTQPLNNQTK
jgi:hypothetical protein